MSEGAKKSAVVRVRVSRELRARCEAAAKQSGVSLSRFLRDAVLSMVEREEREREAAGVETLWAEVERRKAAAGRREGAFEGLASDLRTAEGERDAAAAKLDDAEQRIHEAVTIALRYGQADGAHQLRWAVDQILRVLAGGDYERLTAERRGRDADGDFQLWDEGVAP